MNKTNKLKASLGLFLLIFTIQTASAQIKLPRLISDGMVLQRETPVKIWGWASAGEKVTLHFNQKQIETVTNNEGEWQFILPPQKAGGPHEMKFTASNQVIVKDVLFGEVWLCSGQSNMQLPMNRVAVIYGDDIASSENSLIRMFTVPVKWDYNKPHNDLQGGEWRTANPQNVLSFSAVSYFFSRYLNEKYNIPVGILLCAAGGSAAEGWISEETLKAFPNQYKIAMQLADSAYLRNLIDSEQKAQGNWFYQLGKSDLGRKSPPWCDASLNDSDWPTTQLPNTFKDAGIEMENGAVWLRKEIDLPESYAGKPALLELGRIVDSDSAFVNGQFVGNITYQYPPRRYNVPAGILKAGKNNITVKVVSQSSQGALIKDKPYQLTVNNQVFELRGSWKYQVGATMEPCPSTTYFPGQPLGLFNAMLCPVISYTTRGVIWYQGETNTNWPDNYAQVLTSLIGEWRKLSGNSQLPFLCVQLPDYLEPQKEPTESGWATLRNQQRKILSVPNTSLIVTLGLGEWNDIHPLRKKPIGERLALAAENHVYGEKNIVCSGPLYQSMKIKKRKAILSFTQTGSGLVAKGGELKAFAIAGPDKKYVWAKATIEGDKVIVWNESVPNPVSVRYAWADNPEEANLYNKEGLPASTFCSE